MGQQAQVCVVGYHSIAPAAFPNLYMAVDTSVPAAGRMRNLPTHGSQLLLARSEEA